MIKVLYCIILFVVVDRGHIVVKVLCLIFKS